MRKVKSGFESVTSRLATLQENERRGKWRKEGDIPFTSQVCASIYSRDLFFGFEVGAFVARLGEEGIC